MTTFKLAGLSLIAGVAAIGMSTIATAQETAPAAPQLTLDQVLQAIRKERSEVGAENRQREQRFVQQRNQQQAELNRVRNQVVAAEAESIRLEGVMEANGIEIDRLDAELADKQGEFQELFGAARSAASDLKAQLDSSIITAEYSGRSSELQEIAQTESLPTETQLRFLADTMLSQIVEQAKTTKFTADVALADGTKASRDITRIGPFVAFSDSKYLTYDGAQQHLKFLARQPSGDATSAAGRVEGASGTDFVRATIDPSRGTLLGLIVESPTPMERFEQGRFVGKVIGAIAVIGTLFGIFKWVTLTMTAGAVRGQVRKQKASKGNPLGRVMMAYENTNSRDTETVALKLDDAILKEVPRLEGGLNLIKVLAAVAPLLGLLGTVIGMINTFQAITLYGTGDPQIMASGISEALVTTVLGLIAAIPLLLLHAFASGASRRVTQILEEQAAGIIAEHAEGRS